MNIGAHVAIQVATQAAANMAASQSRVLTALREAGAVSPETAVRITLESRDDESTLASLLEREMVRESGVGHYYVHYTPPSFNRRKRKLVLACAWLILILAVPIIFLVMRSGGGGTGAQ